MRKSPADAALLRAVPAGFLSISANLLPNFCVLRGAPADTRFLPSPPHLYYNVYRNM